MIQSKIKYNTDDFFSLILIKNVAQILFNRLYIQTLYKKWMATYIVKSGVLVAFFMMVLHYVHANFKTHISNSSFQR